MKIRKPIQDKAAPETSGATLASRYLALRRLRDEVRKAETICARRRSNRTAGLKATRLSMRLRDQQFVDLLS
jgi:hypothetical protein